MYLKILILTDFNNVNQQFKRTQNVKSNQYKMKIYFKIILNALPMNHFQNFGLLNLFFFQGEGADAVEILNHTASYALSLSLSLSLS